MKTAQIWDTIHIIGAGIGAFCGWYLGSLDGVLYVLIACTIADYLSGLACAFVKKELSSEIGAKGIAKKVMFLNQIHYFKPATVIFTFAGLFICSFSFKVSLSLQWIMRDNFLKTGG